MEGFDITIELTELAIKSLNAILRQLPLDDDTVMVELSKWDQSLFLKCPVDQGVLDGTVETVECVLDGTFYHRECAELMANQGEKCWICNLMSFKEMLEISAQQ